MNTWQTLLPKLSLECTGLKGFGDTSEQDRDCPGTWVDREHWCHDCLLGEAIEVIRGRDEMISGLRKRVWPSHSHEYVVGDGGYACVHCPYMMSPGDPGFEALDTRFRVEEMARRGSEVDKAFKAGEKR